MKINPVIEKELKTTMRGWRAPLLISLYLGFLLLVTYLFFLANDQMYMNGMQSFNPRVAINAFSTLAFFQLLLLLFIIPILTGGAISSERERQTLDLLLCTSFSTYKVIIGKIFVSIANVLLLIIASFPIMGIVFLFGGIKISSILLLFVFYLITALMIGSLGVFYSTVFKKTIVSIVMTYLTIFVLVVGTYVAMGLFLFFTRVNNVGLVQEEILAFVFPNPFAGFGAIIASMASGNSFVGGLASVTTNNSSGDYSTALLLSNLGFDVLFATLLVIFGSWKLRSVK